MDNTLGIRIEQIRKTERFDIEEFMKSIEVSKTAYYGWKNGDYYPGSDVIIRILNRFPEYRAEWLLLGTGEMKRGGQQSEVVNEPQANYSNTIIIRKEIKDVLRRMIDNIEDL